jgi:ABC-2 type transport system permease protein
MTSWWSGTRLVASRALTQTLRSRAYKVVTGLLLLLSIAVVVLPRLLTEGPPTYTLATVGQADPAVAAQLDAAARAGDFTIVHTVTADAAAVQEAVQNGDATAGLADGTLYVQQNGTGTFPGLVAQAVVAQEAASRLAAAGLTPEQVTDLQSIQSPTQVTVGPVEDEGRAAIGFVLAIVLYLALTFAGNAIATTVGTEKATRISEVLLAVLRPSQILTGNVLAVGVLTLVQLFVLAAPFAVSLVVSDTSSIPTVAAADVALAVAWFVLGFLLYAFVFAAAGALVDKVADVGTAVLPVTVVLVVGYLVTLVVVPSNPSSPLSTAISLFPLTAPMAMPVRWASGQVPVYQLALSMLLTAVAAVLLLALASTIYRRALVLTGRRISIREVLTRK